MISNNARDGFDHMFTQGIKRRSGGIVEDCCEIVLLPDLAENRRYQTGHFNRFICFIDGLDLFRQTKPQEHCQNQQDAESRTLVTSFTIQSLNVEVYAVACEPRIEFLSQHRRKTCIMIRIVPPYFKSAELCGHIHLRIDINNAVRFHASLCVCDHRDLDFKVDVAEVEASTGGGTYSENILLNWRKSLMNIETKIVSKGLFWILNSC
jgi:hypothetical protein